MFSKDGSLASSVISDRDMLCDISIKHNGSQLLKGNDDGSIEFGKLLPIIEIGDEFSVSITVYGIRESCNRNGNDFDEISKSHVLTKIIETGEIGAWTLHERRYDRTSDTLEMEFGGIATKNNCEYVQTISLRDVSSCRIETGILGFKLGIILVDI